MQSNNEYDTSDSYDDSVENYRWEKQVETLKARYRRRIEERRDDKDLRQKILDYYDYEDDQ